MNAIIQLLEKTLPVFVMLGLGMLCRSKKLLSREGVNALKNVAVSIALPAVMFSAFADAQYTLQSVIVPLMIFMLCILMLYAGRALCKGLKIPGRLCPSWLPASRRACWDIRFLPSCSRASRSRILP